VIRPRIAGFGIWIVVLAVTACDGLPGRPRRDQHEVRPDRVESFPVLYARNCAGCHGSEGRGGPSLGLANTVYLAIVDDAALRRVIAGGVKGTGMPAFATSAGGMLTDRQVEILVKGIRAWGGRGDPVPTVGLPRYAADTKGDPIRGLESYGQFCASCHGVDGSSTSKASSIVDASYLRLVSDQFLRTTVIAGRQELRHPDWRGYVPGRSMTPQEVTDVVAWLVSKRPTVPGEPNPAQ
jgi:cytochrome c oxidase cbb3-type subunit 3